LLGLVGYLGLVNIACQAGAADLATSISLEGRAIAMVKKAEKAVGDARCEKAWRRTSCVLPGFCELLRDVAVATARTDLVERAEAAHGRPCRFLLEAKVAFAVKGKSDLFLEEMIGDPDFRYFAEDLAKVAFQHGSLDDALAIFAGMEQVYERTKDPDAARREARSIYATFMRLAPLAGPNPAVYRRALRFADSSTHLTTVDIMAHLPTSAILARAALARPRVADCCSSPAVHPQSDDCQFCSLYSQVLGNRSLPSMAARTATGSDAATLERGRLFLLGIGRDARESKAFVTRTVLLAAIAGALFQIGAANDGQELFLECLEAMGQNEPSRVVMGRVFSVVDDIEAAAGAGLLEAAVLHGLADRILGHPDIPSRRTLLAAMACAMLRSGDYAGADVIISRLCDEVGEGAVAVRWSSRAEVARLCHYLALRAAQADDGSFDRALKLARSIPNDDEARALALLAVIEASARAGEVAEAARLVEELVPLFRIPPGRNEWPPGWFGAALDPGRACFTAGCNTIALRLANEGEHRRALEWFNRGAQYALVYGEAALHDERPRLMRAMLAALRDTRDLRYAREAVKLARHLWRHSPRLQAGWIAIAGLVCSEFQASREVIWLLRQEADILLATEELSAYDRVAVLLTMAEAFVELGAHREARDLMERATCIAKTYRDIIANRDRQQVFVEGDPMTCFPLIARTRVWLGERGNQVSLIEEAAAMLEQDRYARSWWDSGALAVRIAHLALKSSRPNLLEYARVLADQGDYYGPLGLGRSKPPLLEVMLLVGRSGDSDAIDLFEERADAEPNTIYRIDMLTHLARGAFEKSGVLPERDGAHSWLECAQTLLERWQIQRRDGRFEFVVPFEENY
jgi:tetratricopeptide (TPR) repeat protein